VAQLLTLPDTHFLLDFVRPDFLFLRVVSRTLVLWNSVEATDIWVNNQIPSVIINSYHQMINAAKNPTSLADLANFAAMSMSELSDEKSNEGQSHALKHAGSPIKPMESEHDTVPFDRQAIRQSYVYIISGICFSLGLRYAGTGDAGAFQIIYNRAIELQKLRDDNDPVSLVLRPERPVIEMCLGSIAISLGMVMSGTGDLKTFGLFKALRWKCDDSVKYGNHMAYSAAIGLLFLGGGSCTIGNDPEDVAALLVSFFPRFPIHTQDNQYHMQALRHLYAIAVKHRQVDVVDINTGEKVFVPIEIHFNGENPVRETAPCLLLNRDKISKIRVVSDRYYPVELNMNPLVQSVDSAFNLYVSRKYGHLTYLQEPHIPRSHLCKEITSTNASKLIQMLTEDSNVQAFAKYFCCTYFNSPIEAQKRIFSLSATDEEFYTYLLQESLSNERAECISLYLALYNSISTLEHQSCPSAIIWDARILRAYFESTTATADTVSSTFLTVLSDSINRFLATKEIVSSECTSHIQNFITKLCSKRISQDKWLGSVLIWCEVPLYSNMV